MQITIKLHGGVMVFLVWCNEPSTNVKKNSDDWLITPAIHLSSDRVYTVAFKVRNVMAEPKNTLEVKWGKGSNVEQLSNVLLEPLLQNFLKLMDNGKYAQLILFPMRQAMSILDSTIIQVLLISIKLLLIVLL